jgi:hypothetical protein
MGHNQEETVPEDAQLELSVIILERKEYDGKIIETGAEIVS